MHPFGRWPDHADIVELALALAFGFCAGFVLAMATVL